MKVQQFVEEVQDVADAESELVFEDDAGNELVPDLDSDGFQVGQDWTVIPLKRKP